MARQQSKPHNAPQPGTLCSTQAVAAGLLHGLCGFGCTSRTGCSPAVQASAWAVPSAVGHVCKQWAEPCLWFVLCNAWPVSIGSGIASGYYPYLALVVQGRAVQVPQCRFRKLPAELRHVHCTWGLHRRPCWGRARCQSAGAGMACAVQRTRQSDCRAVQP